MEFLNKIKAVFYNDNEQGQGITASAADYVEWLPGFMLQRSQTELRIDTSRPLPYDDGAPGIPDSSAVINRLKVMCGINPFRFSEPVEGDFVRERSGHKVRFAARFEDRDDRSVCTLRLSIRA